MKEIDDYVCNEMMYLGQVKIIAEDENGDDTNGVGELYVKSPSLFKEYWKLPEVLSDLLFSVHHLLLLPNCSAADAAFFIPTQDYGDNSIFLLIGKLHIHTRNQTRNLTLHPLFTGGEGAI